MPMTLKYRKELYDKIKLKYPEVTVSADQLEELGFFTAPASTRFHGAYEGGLFDHSLTVYTRLADITLDNHLTWKRDCSPFVVGMFHDLCKCDQYIEIPFDTMAALKGEEPKKYERNEDLLLEGHGTKSIMILSQYMSLTEEEVLCIRYHMGAYETNDWKGFDRAIRKYPNVLWTHQADMLVSKIDGI